MFQRNTRSFSSLKLRDFHTLPFDKTQGRRVSELSPEGHSSVHISAGQKFRVYIQVLNEKSIENGPRDVLDRSQKLLFP